MKYAGKDLFYHDLGPIDVWEGRFDYDKRPSDPFLRVVRHAGGGIFQQVFVLLVLKYLSVKVYVSISRSWSFPMLVFSDAGLFCIVAEGL